MMIMGMSSRGGRFGAEDRGRGPPSPTSVGSTTSEAVRVTAEPITSSRPRLHTPWLSGSRWNLDVSSRSECALYPAPSAAKTTPMKTVRAGRAQESRTMLWRIRPVGDSGATRVAGRRYFPALPLAGDAAGAANCAWLALSFATSSSKDSVRMILLNWAR
jgi:hypothetical protein